MLPMIKLCTCRLFVSVQLILNVHIVYSRGNTDGSVYRIIHQKALRVGIIILIHNLLRFWVSREHSGNNKHNKKTKEKSYKRKQ